MKADKNPWIAIWTEPRQTIAKIVDENPNRQIWFLAWIYGFLSLLNASQSWLLGNRLHFAAILILSILIAPFWGMLIFNIWSWVVVMIGKMLKGKGSFLQLRAAFAWSCVPLAVNLLFWIILLFIFNSSLFQASQIDKGPIGVLIFTLIAKMIVIIWSLVIYINAIAEVQKFSIARSIVNLLIAWIAVGVVVALIWMVIAFFLSSPLTPSHTVFYLRDCQTIQWI